MNQILLAGLRQEAFQLCEKVQPMRVPAVKDIGIADEEENL